MIQKKVTTLKNAALEYNPDDGDYLGGKCLADLLPPGAKDARGDYTITVEFTPTMSAAEMERQERRQALLRDIAEVEGTVERTDMKHTFKSEAACIAWLTSPAAQGKSWHCSVLHGEQCTPSLCRCHPEFVVEPLTEEAVRAGELAEREFLRATQS